MPSSTLISCFYYIRSHTLIPARVTHGRCDQHISIQLSITSQGKGEYTRNNVQTLHIRTRPSHKSKTIITFNLSDIPPLHAKDTRQRFTQEAFSCLQLYTQKHTTVRYQYERCKCDITYRSVILRGKFISFQNGTNDKLQFHRGKIFAHTCSVVLYVSETGFMTGQCMLLTYRGPHENGLKVFCMAAWSPSNHLSGLKYCQRSDHLIILTGEGIPKHFRILPPYTFITMDSVTRHA